MTKISDGMEGRVQVGIGVSIFKEGKVLLGKRTKDGRYGSPGGHLEFGETLEECAVRETLEETGLEISHLKLSNLANLLIDGKHYIDIGFTAEWKSGEPELKEPDKCEGWEWYMLDALPAPLMYGDECRLTNREKGKLYFGTVR